MRKKEIDIKNPLPVAPAPRLHKHPVVDKICYAGFSIIGVTLIVYLAKYMFANF